MATREKIIQAGLKVFTEKGYEKATTRSIAQEAGVNEVTLFRLFQNKKNILQAVISKNAPIHMSKSDFERGMSGDLETDLYQICLGIYHGLEKNRRAIIMSLCAAEHHQEIRAIVASGPKQQQALLENYFSLLMEQKKIRNIDTTALSRQMIEMVFGLCISSGLDSRPNNQKIAHTVKQFTNHLIHGIKERDK